MPVFSKPQQNSEYLDFADYCEQIEMYNFFVSGGNFEERARATYALLCKAHMHKIPTIILHSGNAFLKGKPLSSLFGGNVHRYEPAKGKTPTEIADRLTDVAVYTLGADRKIFILIQLIVDIISVYDEQITLNKVLDFPCDKLLVKLDELSQSGEIYDYQHKDFAKRYGGTAGDCVAETSRLYSRLKNAWKADANYAGVSMLEVIRCGGILTYDLVTDTNSEIKELCFADVNSLLKHGERFLLVVDGLSVLEEDKSNTDIVLMKNHGNIAMLYCAVDVPQMMSYKDELFNTLVGGHANLVLFRHSSGESAKKWANFFGQEWRTMEDITKGTSAKFTDIFGTHSDQTTKRQMRVDRFPQEEFQKLPFGDGKGFLVDFTKNEIDEQVKKVEMPLLDRRVASCLMTQ